jgi:hypothetical protein
MLVRREVVRVYKCDICGRQGQWGDPAFDWSAYSSHLHDDLCPDQVPTVCGDECKAQLEIRIASGKIALPKIGRGPNPRIGSRKGY